MFRVAIVFLLAVGIASPATLERLPMDQMAQKSTAIVHGKVLDSYSSARGPLIYTHFRISVTERWKGDSGSQVDVAVPGGVVGQLRQSIAGAPKLESGSEYVFFLWSGPSGNTQIIGLSQGVFSLRTDSQGEVTAFRAASTEPMIDPATGMVVQDNSVQMPLKELASRIQKALRTATK